jgi:(1->4)-alpha-D-glucan 1-alpha-D-glucosylmutase
MHIPLSTYRLQLNPDFGFKKTEQVLSYLKDLGISDIYASPILKAAPGSQHGYDVVDPHTINPELGGLSGFNQLSAKAKELGLYWLQDIVPNHMAYHKDNRMLMDIFEQREHSPYFHYFDIDWVHPYENFQGRVLAPFLGSFYSDILDNHELKLHFTENGLSVSYYDIQFPLLLTTYNHVLLRDFDALTQKMGADNPVVTQYLDVINIFSTVTQEPDTQPYDAIKQAKLRLWQLYCQHPDIKAFIDRIIRFYNGETESSDYPDSLDQLLSEQCFRLSFWKVATEELNYRRFFTINDLISLRVEKEDVFDDTHQLIHQLIKDQKIHGLRIDHIDGLYDPATYLGNLTRKTKDTYLIAEKILDLHEPFPECLPVQGTTGYDFMNHVNRLFCDKQQDGALTKLYYKFTQSTYAYEKLVQDKKRLIIGKHMAGDIDNLAHLMKRVAEHLRLGRDITLYGLRRALVEVVACFGVYRTYINPSTYEQRDEAYINAAIAKAHTTAPVLQHEIDFINKFLLLDLLENLHEPEQKDNFWAFIMKFQQLTAPIMAKGYEDTVFYSYNKLISCNEVGGDPATLGFEPEDLNTFFQQRREQMPHTLNATATHDTKRGEDNRARINVLSEIPHVWKTYLKQWTKLNRSKKQRVSAALMPDKNDEYLIYQTLIGSFPFEHPLSDPATYKQRIKDYVIKAIREAKIHTAWIKPDEKYESACLAFVDKLLSTEGENAFLESFYTLHARTAHLGIFNSLGQTLIKMTAPGVPDFYQGTELWDLSLVDPDNRRPVNYGQRRSYLQGIRERAESDLLGLIAELRDTKEDGRIKMFLIHQILKQRRQQPDLFLEGDFLPVVVTGPHQRSVFAFARQFDGHWAMAVVPRLLSQVIKEGEWPLGATLWNNTALKWPEGLDQTLTDVVTRQTFAPAARLDVGAVLNHFPVALLVSGQASQSAAKTD